MLWRFTSLLIDVAGALAWGLLVAVLAAIIYGAILLVGAL